MKKILSTLLCLCMTLLLLAPALAEPATTVEFWHSMSGANGERIDQMIANYNAAQSDIKLVGTFQGNYHEAIGKLQQAIAAGTAPDLMMLERAMIEYFAESDVLLDLKDYVEAAGMTDFFNPGLMGHSWFNDKLVALPYNRSTPIMHVNMTLLKELGFDIPQTWDELSAVCEALVIKEGDEYVRYGMTMPYDTWYPLAMTNQAGGSLLNEDKTDFDCIEDGTLVKALTFIKDMEKDGRLVYPPIGYATEFCNQMFVEQKVGIMFQTTGVIGQLRDLSDFEYMTAFLPADKVRSTPTGGANISIIASSKQPDAAWSVLEWMMKDPDGVLPFILGSGYLPVSPTYVESELVQSLWAQYPMYRIAYEQLEFANDTNKTVHWPEMNDAFLLMIESIMYDDADIEAAVSDFHAESVRILNQ